MLNSLHYQGEKKQEIFNECIKISRMLDINQLKYRLQHDEIQFLECSYAQYIRLERPNKKLYETGFCSIRVDSEGKIEPYDLEALKFEKFLNNIEGIDTVEDLLG